MQACCLRQHAGWTVHRVAVDSFLAPDRPLSQCLPYGLQEQSLWSGNVPQPQDWLRAWRACKTPSSFRSALAFFSTEDYCRGHGPNMKWTGTLVYPSQMRSVFVWFGEMAYFFPEYHAFCLFHFLSSAYIRPPQDSRI